MSFNLDLNIEKYLQLNHSMNIIIVIKVHVAKV